MADVAELIIQLKQMVDESTTGTYPSDGECIDWFNEAQDIIAEETACLTESVSATMDVSVATTIAVPSDWIYGKAFVWSTNTFLTYCEIENLLECGYDLTTTGTPSYWYIHDGYIRFYPVPSADTAYKYYYIRTAAALVTTSSTPQIPTHWHKMLTKFGAYRFWQKEEEPQQAAIFLGEFNTDLTRAKMTQKRRGLRKQYRVKDVCGFA